MTCKHFTLPNGAVGIACTRGSGKTWCEEKKCRREATILCDYIVGFEKTCDRPICRKHATCTGVEFRGTPDADTIDYCREHTDMARPSELEHGWLRDRIVRVRFENLSEKAAAFCRDKGYEADTKAKVVMVSRLGDVGLTRDLGSDGGYDLRLDPGDVDPVDHTCHANGCTNVAHDEIPFCKQCFGLLPETHRKKLWTTRAKGACGGCRKALIPVAWSELYYLGVSIILQLQFDGCGAPPPYQDSEGFCWACGIPDALKNEDTAKKIIKKLGLTT